VSTSSPSLVLATRNAHKLREFERLLPGVDIVALPDEVRLPPETGDSFAENALVKARAAAAQTGTVAIGDDSGIEAEALDGRPGIHSARFAGPGADDAANVAKLCAEAPAGSALRYVCALAHVSPDGSERVFLGECSGSLAAAARGDHGFGYDPVFVVADPSGAGRTMAQLGDAEKDAISHRGVAARRLWHWLSGG
jgi:XTP/dITP diphosphohydrolase